MSTLFTVGVIISFVCITLQFIFMLIGDFDRIKYESTAWKILNVLIFSCICGLFIGMVTMILSEYFI